MNRLLRIFHQLKESRFIRNIGETFVVRVAIAGIAFLTQVYIARSLGPEAQGVYSVAMTLGILGSQFGNLGLHSSNTFFVAKDSAILPKLVGNSLVVCLVMTLISTAIFAGLFWMAPSSMPENPWLVVLIGLYVGGSLSYILMQNLLLGTQKVRPFNVIEILYKVLILGLILFVSWTFAPSPLWFFAMNVSAAYICSMLAIHRLLKDLHQPIAASLTLFREHITYGFKAYLGALFAFLLVRQDTLMIDAMMSKIDVGHYAISANLADVISMFPIVVSSILFPKLLKLEAKAKLSLTLKTLGAVAVIIGLAGGGVAAIAQPLITNLYGTAYLPSAPSFQLLAIAMIFFGCNNILSVYISSIGLPLFGVFVWIIAAVLNGFLNFYLIPLYGIWGAALGSVICYLLVFIMQLTYTLLWSKTENRPE